MTGRKYGNKESHPFPVWNGILEHRRAIGPALWEFLWCVDKITVEKDGLGWCLGKAPIKAERIAADLKESLAAARDNLKRLERCGYIIRTRTPYGHIIGVRNSRKFGIWKTKRELEKTPTLKTEESGGKVQLSQQESGRKSPERVGENSHPELEKTPETKKTQQETQQKKEERLWRDSHPSINRAGLRGTHGPIDARADALPPSDEREKPGNKKPSSQGKQIQNKLRKLPTELRVWMQGRIMRRATGTVRSKHAYLQTAEPIFLENLQAEIEEFLVEQAGEFLKARIGKDPRVIVAWNHVFQHLAIQARRNGLPVDGKVFEVCTRAASQMLGYVERTGQEEAVH